MLGIYPRVISHQLATNPSFKSNKKKTFNQEKREAIREEVEKLLKTRFIRKVHYPKLITNVVIVRKSNEKWRMCVYFTDLNKACHKDGFLFPRIDQLVDSTARPRL